MCDALSLIDRVLCFGVSAIGIVAAASSLLMARRFSEEDAILYRRGAKAMYAIAGGYFVLAGLLAYFGLAL